MTYKRPVDYWCNDDEQMAIIEAALDLYERSAQREVEPTTREECQKRIAELHKEIERIAWIAEGQPRWLSQQEKP